METDIENMEDVLNLPDLPPNYSIVESDASQLKEASNGFSSSLYQLNIRWNAPHGDDLRADAYSLKQDPCLADPKVVTEAAFVGVADDTKDNNSELNADSISVGPAAVTKDNNSELYADSTSVGPAAVTKDNTSKLNADSTIVRPAAVTKDNTSELNAASTSIGTKDNNSELDADSISVSVAADASTNNNDTASRDTYQCGEISLIVKRMPDRSLWISLNSEATFEKELNMYSLLAPTYDTILDQLADPNSPPRAHHNNLFPKFLGGRLNLKNDPDYVDEHAVILLENLKQSGYENCRRSNLDGSHFIATLTRLAVFHAVGIIIRNDPKYKTTFQNMLKTSRTFFFGAKDKDMDLKNSKRRETIMETVAKLNDDGFINAKLNNILEQTDKKTLPSSDTCYSSLLHNDLWVNNIMFKYISKEVEHTDDNSKGKHEIEDVKFIDLQNTNFGSVAKDFIFLMYTSADKSIWPYIETYAMFYHEMLVANLTLHFGKQFVRVHEYSFDRFRDELKMYACHKLKHIINVLKQMYGEHIELYESHLKRILDHCIEYDFI